MMINDCLIIGAGQAGLGLAALLTKKNRTVLLLERDANIGDVWRRRPDSMVLFTPRCMSHLPDLTLRGDQKGYPTKNEIADYLQQYATHFSLQVLTNKEANQVNYQDQIYTVTCKDGTQFKAYSLVNATGANQVVNIPALANEIASNVVQLPIDHYHNPQQFVGYKNIAIIGDGSGGRQIAKELAKANYCVTLFCGVRRRFMPQEIFGINTLFLLKKMGLLNADTYSQFGRWLKIRNIIPCNNITNKILQEAGVNLTGKLIQCQGNQLVSANGDSLTPEVVIWGVGYREDTDWLTLKEATDSKGFVCQNGHQNGGKTPYEDLFVVGRRWLSCRASELIAGSEDDGVRVAQFVDTILTKKRANS